MTSPLDDNLAALAQIDAASLAWVHGPASGSPLAIEGQGEDVRLIAADGRSLRLHSARDPRREAAALVAEALGDRPASVVAIVGAGAGFVLEALESRPEIRLLVVEPTRELALAWLARRSWRTLLESGRLRVMVGPDYAGSASASGWLGGTWSHLPVVVNPVLVREAASEVTRARAVLDRAAREALQNDDARGRFEDSAFRNTTANLPLLLSGADVANLTGAFRGRAAIVVGAGPSLDANVEALRLLQSSCLVIAADTAVVPCVKGGLVPHLAVALDPSLDNARHLTRLVVPDSVHLVCEASVDPSVARAFAGRTFFFRVGRHAPWSWLESAGITLGTLEAWGSVVTSALDLAVRAGCSPIIFAGLDLAFTKGQPYCRYTPLDDLWAWQVAAGDRLEDLWAAHRSWRPAVMERALEGGDTPTAAHLVTFRDWIRDYAAARPQIRFVNGTGAGILHGTSIDVVGLDVLASILAAAETSDIGATVARMCTGDAPPGQAADVLSRLAAASPLDLLEGHSAPHAAAERVGLAALLAGIETGTIRPSAAAAHAQSATTPDAGPGSGARLWLPDVARALRSLDPRHHEAFAGMDQLNPAEARACLDRAFDTIGHVLRQELDATQNGAFHDARADAWADVPALVQVGWPPAVRPLVEAATAALHEALQHGGWPIRLDDRPSAYFTAPADPHVEASVTGPSADEGQVPPFEAGLDALIWQWVRVAAAVLDADAAIGRVVSCLRATRPARLPSTRVRCGLRVWLAPARPAEGTDGVPVLPFLHDRAVMRAATGLLTLDPASLPASGAAPATPGALRLFALPESWSPDAERVRSRRIPWSTVLAPDVLTDRGLGPCRLATRLNETQALLTRFDGSGSYTIDESGRIGRSEAWSRRIDGEIRCGETERLAWNWDGAQHLLFRPAPGMDDRAWELPVAPMHALDTGEASALLATTGGLWRWSADAGPQPVASGPVLVALHRHGTDVRLYPRPTLHPDGSRRATDRAFDWTDGASACVERALTPGDACFSRSRQGEWTADTCMDASAVRLTHRTGATFWLACSGPRSAAWAGRSLVVTLLGPGDVLLFRSLLDVVEPLVRGGEG